MSNEESSTDTSGLPVAAPLSGLPLELRVAVERGYLSLAQAREVQWRARSHGEGVSAAILALGLLSARRLRRVENHVRYRLMRRQDRRYALLARSLVATPLLVAALAEQRERFATRRERVRLGQLLVRHGLLSASQDRWLIAQLTVQGDQARAWDPAPRGWARGA